MKGTVISIIYKEMAMTTDNAVCPTNVSTSNVDKV